MNVVIIGASGFVGSALVREALTRGHRVRGLVRDASKLAAEPGLELLAADVTRPGVLEESVRGQDAVISAYSSGTQGSDAGPRHVAGYRGIVAALERAQQRLLVVGGAGSLEVAPGVQLVDTPDFPPLWKPNALATREVLELLRASTLDWTFLSPAAQLEPGARTGRFRLGGDALLTDAAGASRISLGDYAQALIDELEAPRHVRRRFSVAY